jgi:DNA-binding MarR family transcriptional regulator
MLAAFGYATVDQVARMQGTRPTAASIMLAALERRGLVARHRQHHLHKDVYSPTAEGLAAVGSPLPPVPRVPVQRRHALALVDLAHDLAAETGGRWETQRELAHAGLGAGGRAPHGRLHLPDGRCVAVRLELSSQPRHTVLELAARQLGAGQCQEVWFVVAPEWERRYAARLEGRPGVAVRPWAPPDRLGGPRGFRADSAGREGRTALPAR